MTASYDDRQRVGDVRGRRRAFLFFICMLAAVALSALAVPDQSRVFAQTQTGAAEETTYQGVGEGRNGSIEVMVHLEGDAIQSVEVKEQQETPEYWEEAKAILASFVGIAVADQTSAFQAVDQVDTISGATLSSEGIKAAVKNALALRYPEIPGTGTQRDPFVIATQQQLVNLAEKVDEGDAKYAGENVHVALVRDIDLSGIDSWNPIGAEGKASANQGKLFAGSFDGQGHTINGLHVSGEYDTEANLGLFSTLAATARVSDVVLTDVHIEVTQTGAFSPIRAGGIAGDTVRGSASPAVIADGTSPAANANGTSPAAIADGCQVSGAISIRAEDGQSLVGGIFGRAFTGAAILNCVTDVVISANADGQYNSACAGGIAGMTGNNTVLANCAAFGEVAAENTAGRADAYAGGLTGMLTSTTYNCYAAGNIALTQKAGVSPQFIGALAGQQAAAPQGALNYYAKDVTLTVIDEAGNAVTQEPRAWSSDEMNGKVTAEEPVSLARMGQAAFAETLNANLSQVAEILSGSGLAVREWVLTDDGRAVLSDTIWESGEIDDSLFAGGAGTEADPYRIETPEQLAGFAASLNSRIDYYGKSIRLEADLNLAGQDWTPVGGSYYRFDGEFDGGGHTIIGLREGSEEQPLELSGSNAYIGLFGWINEHARIHDVNLEKVAMYTVSSGSAYVGGIAGRMSGTDTEGDYRGAGIDNCHVSGVISHTTQRGTSFIGGICGHVFKGSIINTGTDVELTGIEKSGQLVEVGGIAGLLNRGLVANCYALGNITGSGYRDTQYDIEGMACVGGIAAVNGGSIVNCYAQGDVEALEYSIDTGVLAGWVTGIGKAYTSWYSEDAKMTIDGRNVSPVDPFGETVAGGVSDEWGFTFPGALVYEVKGFHPDQDAQKVADGLNAAFGAFPIDVAGVYGLPEDSFRGWTVQDGRADFSDTKTSITYVQPPVEQETPETEVQLQDGTWEGRSADRSVVARITVEKGEITKQEVLTGEETQEGFAEALEYALGRAAFKARFGDASTYEAADPSVFKGQGTAADPYRIETEEQLRYLAASINEDTDWQGVYFRQSADITMDGEDWQPIGWGIFADADEDGFGHDVVALYPFRGAYDGAGHVIRGLHAGTKQDPAAGNYMGLFGIVQGDYEGNEIPVGGYRAQITDVHLEDVAFFTENRWRSYIGGLVANAQGGFTIDHCSVTGTISSRSSEDFAFAGGLAGSLMYGSVLNAWTDVDVTSWSAVNYSYAAGMSAVTNRATLVNSFALGDVHADADQTNHAEGGGFTALDGGVCVNCYARGNVESVSKYSMYIGGFCGMAASASEHRMCYYNTDANQMIAGKPAEEKKYAGKFVNESAEANAQAQTAQTMSSKEFVAILEEGRRGIAEVLSEVRSALEADENGSSRYHSLYYNGDGSELSQWVLADGVVTLQRLDRTSAEQAGGADGKARYEAAVKKAAGKRVKITKLKPGKKKGAKRNLTVKWKPDRSVSGYQVRYSVKKNMKKGVKTRTVAKSAGKKLVLKKLRAGKTWYVQIRPYTNVKNPSTGKTVKIYGKWSAAKKVKVKK